MEQIARKVEIIKSCTRSDAYFNSLYKSCLEYANIQIHDDEEMMEMKNQVLTR